MDRSVKELIGRMLNGPQPDTPPAARPPLARNEPVGVLIGRIVSEPGAEPHASTRYTRQHEAADAPALVAVF
jgi:hypothetical protein